jgi:hypothetical protein
MTKDSLHQEALARAKKAGIPVEYVELALRAKRKDRPYVVEFEVAVEGPFYRITKEGPSTILYINIDHPFYRYCYGLPGFTQRQRDMVEILLWSLAIPEVEGDDQTQKMYVQERQQWSKGLRYAFEKLNEIMDFDSLYEAELAKEFDEEWLEDEDG